MFGITVKYAENYLGNFFIYFYFRHNVGIMAGCIVLDILMFDTVLTWGLAAMTLMMLIGVWDDVKDISARFRLLIEIFLVLAFIFITDTYIDDFHGLWSINALPPEFGIPFSVLAGVGIINAVNLIDGVDGYSSGYGILACICFGLMSRNVWDPVIQCLTLIVIAALVPFFMHNVFGRRSNAWERSLLQCCASPCSTH